MLPNLLRTRLRKTTPARRLRLPTLPPVIATLPPRPPHRLFQATPRCEIGHGKPFRSAYRFAMTRAARPPVRRRIAGLRRDPLPTRPLRLQLIRPPSLRQGHGHSSHRPECTPFVPPLPCTKSFTQSQNSRWSVWRPDIWRGPPGGWHPPPRCAAGRTRGGGRARPGQGAGALPRAGRGFPGPGRPPCTSRPWRHPQRIEGAPSRRRPENAAAARRSRCWRQAGAGPVEAPCVARGVEAARIRITSFLVNREWRRPSDLAGLRDYGRADPPHVAVEAPMLRRTLRAGRMAG